MTDLWVEANACTPIMVTFDGVYGSTEAGDPIPKRQICWVCMTPWPCQAYRTGSLNTVQQRAVPADSENPNA